MCGFVFTVASGRIRYMSVTREEPHHLVDRLPEEKVAPLLRLVRGRLDERPTVRDLPFIGTLEAEPDFTERSEEILARPGMWTRSPSCPNGFEYETSPIMRWNEFHRTCRDDFRCSGKTDGCEVNESPLPAGS